MKHNRIELIIGDISLENVDAIVNAANTDLILGSGVAGAIRRRGGPSVQEECLNHGAVELGGVALTHGGDLPAKWVIHAASMHIGGKPCDDSIRRATSNALGVAFREKFETISFPALGNGVGGYSAELSARLMLIETIKFLAKHDFPKLVRFVLFDDTTYKTFAEVANNLQ